MKDKTLLYITISMIIIAIYMVIMAQCVWNYPSRGYYYGENLDVGTNMSNQIK